jgi:hypothetical protein
VPEIILFVAVLGLIGLAIRSMVRAVAEMRLAGIEQILREEPIEVPAEEPPDVFAWVHERLMRAYAAEREGWALDLVRRVDARLQADVPADERLETVVLWIPEATAFTLPGRHVYFSRRLLERAPGEEVVAMIVAHELAHHRLGHIRSAETVLERVPAPMRDLATDLYAAHATVLTGPEREAETDAVGLNLCLAAGYDGERCIHAFDLLEALALDDGDRDGALGPLSVIDATLDGEPEWLVDLRQWAWERRRGYLSLRERKTRLLTAYREAVAAAGGSDARMP